MDIKHIQKYIMGKIPCFYPILSHNVRTKKLFLGSISHLSSQSFKLTGFNLISHGLCISGRKRENNSR